MENTSIILLSLLKLVVEMGGEIPVLIYGLGHIGSEIFRLLQEKPGIQIVGAIDADPEKVGKDAGIVAGMGKESGVIISGASDVIYQSQPKAVLHSTTSFLKEVYEQIIACIDAGACVISTCEELAYPYHKHPGLAKEIDERAKKRGVAVIATGVNPGFIMDRLVLTFTSACQRVDSVKVRRIVDASLRREPLQKKVGVGLSIEEFQKGVEDGSIMHRGLEESALIIAERIGWKLDEMKEQVQPVFQRKKRKVVSGIYQVWRGFSKGEEKITLKFKVYQGAKDVVDEIIIKGNPDIHVRIPGGIHGDLATPAIVVNTIPFILKASPGLHTPEEISAGLFSGTL